MPELKDMLGNKKEFTKLVIMAIFLIIFFIGVYVIFLKGKTPQLVTNEILGESAAGDAERKLSSTAEIPKFTSYNNILWKIDALDLMSFVRVPIEAGKMGRDNPFQPVGALASIEAEERENSSSRTQGGPATP